MKRNIVRGSLLILIMLFVFPAISSAATAKSLGGGIVSWCSPPNVKAGSYVDYDIIFDVGARGYSGHVSFSGLEYVASFLPENCTGSANNLGFSFEATTTLPESLKITYTFRVLENVGNTVSFRVDNIEQWNSAERAPIEQIVSVDSTVVAPCFGNIEIERTDLGGANIRQGDMLQFHFYGGAEGFSADIETEGLQLDSWQGWMAEPTHITTIDPPVDLTPVAYNYRVTASAGETISITLKDILESIGEKEQRSADVSWTAQVQGVPVSSPVLESVYNTSDVTVSHDDSGKYVSLNLNWPGGFSVAGVMSQIRQYPGYSVAITRGELNEPLEMSQIVVTGDSILIREDATGAIIDFAAIIVKGDVLGIGDITISQLVREARAFRGTDPLTGVFLRAGDIYENGVISLNDLVAHAKLFKQLRNKPV